PGIPGDPAKATVAWDINNAGQIVVSSLAGHFLYASGVFTFISLPGNATGINDIGQLVGTFGGGAGLHGFLDTNGLLTTIDFPGATCTGALAINNAGQVVGAYLDSVGREHGFIATPVPESGSNACPLGQGFWKNHPGAWPVSSLTLGSQTYVQAQLLTILTTP